jgi:hypothetical protein
MSDFSENQNALFLFLSVKPVYYSVPTKQSFPPRGELLVLKINCLMPLRAVPMKTVSVNVL